MVNKNFYRLFFVVFLMSVPLRSLAKKNYIFASNPASSQTEVFIRDLQKELHMESYKISINGLAQRNAMVATNLFNGRYDLYINEALFNDLSRDGKRFVIGHEFMHIRHSHLYKRVAFSLLFPQLSSLIFPLWRTKIDKYYPKPWPTLWYSRYNEKDADISCAKRLKCANGGVELFEMFEKEGGMVFSFFDFFSTHPSHKKRIKYLKKLAQSSAYQK